MKSIKSKFSGSKILLVDDYMSNQVVAKEYLEIMDCNVEIAENGEQAIAMFKERDYNLILMDLQLPKKDGYFATKTIRKIERNKMNKVPIIAVTANAMGDDKAKCLAAGMDDYISKPICVLELEKVLSKYLNKKVINE